MNQSNESTTLTATQKRQMTISLLVYAMLIMSVGAFLSRIGQGDLLDVTWIAHSGSQGLMFIPLLITLIVMHVLQPRLNAFRLLMGAASYIIADGAANSLANGNAPHFVIAIVCAFVVDGCFSYTTQRIKKTSVLAVIFIVASFFAALVVGAIIGAIWPDVTSAIYQLSASTTETGSMGLFLFGLFNRLLIPFGLHHAFDGFTWFDYGQCQLVIVEPIKQLSGLDRLCVSSDVYSTLNVGVSHTFNFATGSISAVIKELPQQVVNGDLDRFYAGDLDAGKYMAGLYPSLSVGLPMMVLAILARTPQNVRQPYFASVLLLVVFSALTGVSEPLEFLLLVLSPLLFVVHALLTGCLMLVCYSLDLRLAVNYSSGWLDLFSNVSLLQNTVTWCVLFVATAVIYWFVTRLLSSSFSISLPELTLKLQPEQGKGIAEGFERTRTQTTSFSAPRVHSATELASHYLSALGGGDNLTGLDTCITRLRITLKDRKHVNESLLSNLGVKGVVKLGENHIQLIIGPAAENIGEEMKSMVDGLKSNQEVDN